MKNKFYCQNCKTEFVTHGKRIDYQDHIYGPCWKMAANCPTCQTECVEQNLSGTSKKGVDFDAYVKQLQQQGGVGCCGGGGCGGGGCCG